MFTRKTLLTLFLVCTSPILLGWTYLVPGENYPSEGPGVDHFLDEEGKSSVCTPQTNPLTGCYSAGNKKYPYVLLYGYWHPPTIAKPLGYNEMLPNPGLIAEYAKSLYVGCVDENLSKPLRQEHCRYLRYQVKYLSENYISPHKGLDIWPLPNNGHNHALIELFDLMSNWEAFLLNPPPFPNPRTPNPFTVSDYLQFNVRISRGLNTLRGNSSPNPPWPRVRDFHESSTNQSYYRTSSNGDVPEQIMKCDDHYHEQNYKTLNQLIGRGLDSAAGTLQYYADKWQYECQ